MIQETQTYQDKVEWGLPFIHEGFMCRAGKLKGKWFAMAKGRTLSGIQINVDVEAIYPSDREALQELFRRIKAI